MNSTHFIYVEESLILEILQFSTFQVIDLTGNLCWRKLSSSGKNRVYDRVWEHIYRVEFERRSELPPSDPFHKKELSDEEVLSMMPMALKDYTKVYEESSEASLTKKQLSDLQTENRALSSQLSDLKSEIELLKERLSERGVKTSC